MTRTKKAIVALTLLASLLAVGGGASADHSSSIHWASGPAEFRISTTVPAEWHSAIINAANTWSWFTGIDFAYTGLTSNTDPGTGEHILTVGQIPGDWSGFCPVPNSLPGSLTSQPIACTRVSYYLAGWWAGVPQFHIADADTVFNVNFLIPLAAIDPVCLKRTYVPTTGIFVTPVAPIDVQTVALHEMGHWGFLGHSSVASTVMEDGGYKECRRDLTGHDIDAMNATNAPHEH